MARDQPTAVIPAKAGIHGKKNMDSGFRRNDEGGALPGSSWPGAGGRVSKVECRTELGDPSFNLLPTLCFLPRAGPVAAIRLLRGCA